MYYAARNGRFLFMRKLKAQKIAEEPWYKGSTYPDLCILYTHRERGECRTDREGTRREWMEGGRRRTLGLRPPKDAIDLVAIALNLACCRPC